MRAVIYGVMAVGLLSLSFMMPTPTQAHSVTLWKTHEVLRHRTLTAQDAAKKKSVTSQESAKQPKSETKH